eukprot:COSAG05_NODE_13557_length_425_cov_1.423313_2_plen_22_part_01
MGLYLLYTPVADHSDKDLYCFS